MTTRIEYGTKTAADAIRDWYHEHLCSDDDRRLKAVAFSSDTPDAVLDQAREQALDSRAERESSDEQAIEGAESGALKRSWSGYKGAVRRLSQAIEAADQAWSNAQQAAKAINSIREAHGQDPIHFEVLEELQADLLDLTRKAAADCHECHADHASHEHATTEGDVENLPKGRSHLMELVVHSSNGSTCHCFRISIF